MLPVNPPFPLETMLLTQWDELLSKVAELIYPDAETEAFRQAFFGVYEACMNPLCSKKCNIKTMAPSLGYLHKSLNELENIISAPSYTRSNYDTICRDINRLLRWTQNLKPEAFHCISPHRLRVRIAYA